MADTTRTYIPVCPEHHVGGPIGYVLEQEAGGVCPIIATKKEPMDVALLPDTLTIFDFAAGTGMFSTAIEIALETIGRRAVTVGYCERESGAAATIVARMEAKAIRPAPIWDDARTFDASVWRGCVDIFVAGYPCQPFSSAGKGLGHRDPRHLWPACRRAIARINPGIVFLENVDAHVRRGGGKVTRDLERLGYETTCGLFSSEEVGASHKRERLFILGVAHSTSKRQRETGGCCAESQGGIGWERPAVADAGRHEQGRGNIAEQGPQERNTAGRGGEDLAQPPQRGFGELRQSPEGDGLVDGCDKGMADTECKRFKGRKPAGGKKTGVRRRPAIGNVSLPHYAPMRHDYGAWAAVAELDPARMPAIESELCGMADGLASRADRLRLVGNGVDPLVAAYAFLSLLACIGEPDNRPPRADDCRGVRAGAGGD